MDSNDEIIINIFCDEMKRRADHILSVEKSHFTEKRQEWCYIGVLVVPVNKEKDLLKSLLDRRCTDQSKSRWTECNKNCGKHERNNTEVHYSECTDRIKYEIAKNWLDFLMQNNRCDYELIYFKILGIELTKLNLSLFGNEHEEINVYQRFFRTAIIGAIKYCFPNKKVIINKIFHDKDHGLENHEHFPNKIIKVINIEEENINCLSKKVIFIDSDHRQEKTYKDQSHFIQFIDLILGSICACFHGDVENKGKIDLAQTVQPLVHRLTNNPTNKNSHFNYFRKQSVSFFPKYKYEDLNHADSLQMLDNIDNFYTRREVHKFGAKQISMLDL